MSRHSSTKSDPSDDPGTSQVVSDLTDSDRLRLESLALQQTAETLREARDELQSRLDLVTIERDELARKLGALCSPAKSGDVPFDPTKQHRVVEAFRSVVGLGGIVDLAEGDIVRDAYLLRNLKNAGAQLIQL